MAKVHASLFSGFGAADLAATWMGWDNAFWCEIEDLPQTVLSYWFPKSKGYGNAIVPQVMYEIFKAIETIQDNIK